MSRASMRTSPSGAAADVEMTGWASGQADTDRLLPPEREVGHEARRGEHEGVRSRRLAAQDAVGGVVDHGVAGHLGHVGAQEGQLVRLGELLELVDAFDGALVEEVAADAVVGVGGERDEAARRERLHGAIDEPGLRVFRIDRDDGSGRHALTSSMPALVPG